VPVAAEAEDRRWVAEVVREVRERRDADATADEHRLLDVEPVAVAERAEDVELVARLDRGQRPGSWPDRLEQEAQLARRRLAEAHRARQQSAGRLEHEELPRNARLEPAAFDANQRVGADGLVRDDSKRFSSAH
jgi:hypothetical protein